MPGTHMGLARPRCGPGCARAICRAQHGRAAGALWCRHRRRLDVTVGLLARAFPRCSGRRGSDCRSQRQPAAVRAAPRGAGVERSSPWGPPLSAGLTTGRSGGVRPERSQSNAPRQPGHSQWSDGPRSEAARRLTLHVPSCGWQGGSARGERHNTSWRLNRSCSTRDIAALRSPATRALAGEQRERQRVRPKLTPNAAQSCLPRTFGLPEKVQADKVIEAYDWSPGQRGSKRIISVDQVTCVAMGATTPPLAWRTAPRRAPITTAAATSARLPVASSVTAT